MLIDHKLSGIQLTEYAVYGLPLLRNRSNANGAKILKDRSEIGNDRK